MIPSTEYESRRASFLSKMEEESFAVLFSGVPKKCSADEDYPFEVNRNFFYLTGITQFDSALLLIKSGGEEREFLFILPFDPVKEKWYGKRLIADKAYLTECMTNGAQQAYHLTSKLIRKVYRRVGFIDRL